MGVEIAEQLTPLFVTVVILLKKVVPGTLVSGVNSASLLFLPSPDAFTNVSGLLNCENCH